MGSLLLLLNDGEAISEARDDVVVARLSKRWDADTLENVIAYMQACGA